MATKNGQPGVPEWASRIVALRRRLGMSQGELAKRLECSAMTISRWERGLQPPTAEFYIQIGKLAGTKECWFFWERAGLRFADFERATPSTQTAEPSTAVPPLESARAGTGATVLSAYSKSTVALPVLKAVAGTQGAPGPKKWSLERIPSSRLMGAPSEWCPNPRYTSLLHVRGHSMEPLIRNGDILAVDSFQTDKSQLNGKIVVVAHEEKGLCVSRLRRYEDVDVLESANRDYEGIVLGKNSGWQLVGKVLWWISAAP